MVVDDEQGARLCTPPAHEFIETGQRQVERYRAEELPVREHATGCGDKHALASLIDIGRGPDRRLRFITTGGDIVEEGLLRERIGIEILVRANPGKDVDEALSGGVINPGRFRQVVGNAAEVVVEAERLFQLTPARCGERAGKAGQVADVAGVPGWWRRIQADAGGDPAMLQSLQ